MLKSKSPLVALILLLLVSLACEESAPGQRENQYPALPSPANPLSKGRRVLELDVNPPEDENFDSAVELAKDLGAEAVRLSIYWDDFESSPGVFDPDPNWLAIANQYYAAQDLKISLTISVLDTTEIRLPADLVGKPFSDPEVIERFTGFLDYAITQLTDVELVYLAIGNEIDGVLGGDPSAWQDFGHFFQETAAHARKIWPSLPISTKVTFDGLFNQAAPYAKEIYRETDPVMVTYYPLNGDFSVKDPQIVVEDFQTLIALFPEKQILIPEIGYPTSPVNKSSEEKQAEFIHYAFQAWDEHQEQITLLSYSWLTDLPAGSVKDLEAYYGLKDKGFAEYLRTLGLRTYPGAGEDKIGYQVFRTEAEARGW